MAPEGRERRRERQHRVDATLLRRRAEEVLHPDARGEPGRAQPALRGVAGQRGGDLHAIGQELLHVHGGRSDLLVGLAVLHDRERDGVGAGGRALDGLVRQVAEAAGAQRELLALDRQTAWIDDLEL